VKASVVALAGPHGGLDAGTALVLVDELTLDDAESAAVEDPQAAIRTTRANSPQRTRTRSRVRTGPNASK
jgi:hypothetical protein